jgi:hypothetical protein
MVVPFPDQAIRTLTAVIACHRRLLRMTADDKRRWSRVAPTFERGRYAPKLATIPLGTTPRRRLATMTAR